MIKTLEVIRPADFPYMVMSFSYYYNTLNSHLLNMYHAAGMNFMYKQKRECYLFPQNECYRLYKIQNTEPVFNPIYNWIVMKAILDLDGDMGTDVNIEIENEEILELMQPDNHVNKKSLRVGKLPENGDDIVISDNGITDCFYHFYCIQSITSGKAPTIILSYLNTYPDFYHILNEWFNEENKIEMFP